jgi:hypothetical protein
MLADAGRFLPPWYSNRLISWWDMEKFSAEHYFNLGRAFCQLEQLLASFGPVLTTDDAQWLQDGLPSLAYDCRRISLKETAKCVDRLVSRAATGANCNDLKIRFDDLRVLFHSEMESNVFQWIPPHEAEYFTQPKPLMGDAVAANFPSAKYDIEESGKCLALNRDTACVLHLVRVLEVALDVIGDNIGLNPHSPTWNAYLTGITPAALKKYPAHESENREWRAFYSGVEGHLRAVKDAWRNDTIHNPSRVYGAGEAKDLLNLVAAFMRHLATRLKEPPSS